jgi:hypothetical protein
MVYTEDISEGEVYGWTSQGRLAVIYTYQRHHGPSQDGCRSLHVVEKIGCHGGKVLELRRRGRHDHGRIRELDYEL